MKHDENDSRRVLIGIVATVRQSVKLAEQFGTPAEKEFVREATAYIGRQLENDPTCDPQQANTYIDELLKLITVWREKAPDKQRVVMFKYERDNYVNADGAQLAQGGIKVEGGAGPMDIVEAAMMFYDQVQDCYPEEFEYLSKRLMCVNKLVGTINPEELEGKSIGEVINYMRAKLENALASFGKLSFSTDNQALQNIWQDVLDTFEKIESPDDLDHSVYKRLIHLLEETGNDPSQEDIDKMLPEIEKMHDLLKRSL